MLGGQAGGIILLVMGLFFFVVAKVLSDDFQNLSSASMWTLAIGILLILLGCAAVLFGAYICYILLYRAWEAIQDGHARTTPGKAAGLIFIPFFNFYWVFVTMYGFAQDYNRYIERHAVNARKLKEGLFLAFCILFICGMLPFISYLAGLPLLALLAVTANETIDAVNALPVGTANQ